jgi:hypothetical protein
MHCSKKLFDYLVGAQRKCGWYTQPEHLCGLKVDHQFKFGWCLNCRLPAIYPFRFLPSKAAAPMRSSNSSCRNSDRNARCEQQQ